MEYKKLELPASYKPKGYKHRKGKPKGYNKVLYLIDSGLKDPNVIKMVITSHYYTLLDEKGIHGKQRHKAMATRKNQLRKSLKAVKKLKLI